MSETRLVNRKHTDTFSVDIGRANYGKSHMNNTPVGKPGWLGNPYPEREYGREKCIELFRSDFEERILSDPDFRIAVSELDGETLACYCKPKPCHGDVIVEYIRFLRSDDGDDGGREQ